MRNQNKLLKVVPIIALILTGLFVSCYNNTPTDTETDAENAAAALTVDDFTFSGTETSSAVTTDFTLPLTGEIEGTTVSWSSGDTTIISIGADGTASVTQPGDADTVVTLTATITDAEGNSATKTFDITVLASSQYIEANIIYSPSDSGTEMEVIGYESGISGSVTILSTADGLPVTTIAANAFENLATVTAIAVPSSITTIENAAFKNCTAYINFPSGSGAALTSIGDEAFYGSGISTLNLNSSSITSISTRAFYDCDNLGSLSLPSSLTSIGEEAFAELETLDNISVPNTVTTIETGAFKNSIALTSLALRITAVPDDMASGCTSLGTVEFYSTVISIGTNAFDNSGISTFMMSNDTPPTATADCFTGISGATLRVNNGQGANFSGTAPWDAGSGIFSTIQDDVI